MFSVPKFSYSAGSYSHIFANPMFITLMGIKVLALIMKFKSR